MRKTRHEKRILRQARVRRRTSGTSQRPRLAVFRSNSHIYAQIVDDHKGVTLAAVNSLTREVREMRQGKKQEIAKLVGKKVAELAVANGIKQVVLDRGGFLYHGQVKALADGAREGGLQF
ncbi:MAG: 50S ribosomal protein L18 [bacterium]